MSIKDYIEHDGRTGRGGAARPRRSASGAIIAAQWVGIVGLGGALAASQMGRAEANAARYKAEARAAGLAQGEGIEAVWELDRDQDGASDPASRVWSRADGTPRPGVYRYIVIVDTNEAEAGAAGE